MRARLYDIAELTPEDRTEMRNLLDRHFAGVTLTQFEADLRNKQWALILRDAADRLAGFSTLAYARTSDQGKPLAVLYSGDTIVDPAAWGTTQLLRNWLRAVWQLHEMNGGGRLVWLLITSGFRTYRFLPVFWQRFYPRFDSPTPDDVQNLLTRLASERYGSQFQPTHHSGIVKLHRPQVLREHLTGIPAGRARDPHVAFFAEANPGHEQGDELVCLAEMSPDNLTPAGRRMAGLPLREPLEGSGA